MKAKPLPTYFDLKCMFEYNPSTGDLIWRIPVTNVPKGSVAGHKHPSGYLRVGFEGKYYPAHRIIWKLVHGEDPVDFIDHIDGNRANNRIENLRSVPKSQNAKNHRPHPRKSAGLMGVYWRDNGWAAQITANGEYHYLGKHTCLLDAASARKSAEFKLGFHENHGTHIPRPVAHCKACF